MIPVSLLDPQIRVDRRCYPLLCPKPHLQQSTAVSEHGLWIHSRAPHTTNLTLPVLQASSVQRNLLKTMQVTELKMGSVSPVSQKAHQPS